MADYKKLYAILFNKMSDVIEELIKTQQETEELYISEEEVILRVFDKGEDLDLE